MKDLTVKIIIAMMFFVFCFFVLDQYMVIAFCPDNWREGSDCYASWWQYNVYIYLAISVIVSWVGHYVLSNYMNQKK